MRKMIGYTDNRPVYFNEASGTITVYGTWIIITNVTRENVLDVAKRNIKNFSLLLEGTDETK